MSDVMVLCPCGDYHPAGFVCTKALTMAKSHKLPIVRDGSRKNVLSTAEASRIVYWIRNMDCPVEER